MESTAIQQYEAKGQGLLSTARNIMIVDETTREVASEFSLGARKMVKAIEEEFRPDIDKAHQLHKGLCDRLKRLTDPIKQAQAIVDGEIKRDYLERERVRQEEERKAREKAEEEQRRQEEELSRQANDLIEKGDLEGAEDLFNTKIVTNPITPVAQVESTTKTGMGAVTMRKDIEVEVADKKAIITAVFRGELPDGILVVDVGVAKRYAKAAGLKSMPGFRITETAVTSGRTR